MKEVPIDPISHEPLDVNDAELAILTELLAAERDRLLVEIRHTHHRAFRNDLRERLRLVEWLPLRYVAVARAG